jgi:LPS export ABC transporter permease LptG/LPS export ABC transporter permease LptF
LLKLVRTIDRYLIREILPPFLIALAVFTFVLDIMPLLDAASALLAKGVALRTIAVMLALLLPQALGLTIPMAFLTGLLMALGRLSGDREAVAMLACGISPMRLFRPVLFAGIAAGLLTLYVMVWLLPDCNQRYNNIAWRLLSEQTEHEVKPLRFYDGFPGKVLYVQDANPVEGWSGVFVADTTKAGRPSVATAERGRLYLNRERQQVVLSLRDATEYMPGTDERVYDRSRTVSSEPLLFTILASDMFQPVGHGFPEMSIAELRASIAAENKVGMSGRIQYFYWQQMFSFPVACLVFALLGLPIGLHTRKEGKLAGFVVGLGVVFLYYALMKTGESVTKGNMLPPVWARWVPNLILGPIGIAVLWWRARAGVTGGLRLSEWIRWRPSRRPATAAAPRMSADAASTSSRIPGARLLDRYVGRVYLRIAALAFFGLLLLNNIGAFIDMSGHVFKHEATMAIVGRYLWYSTPQFITWLVPMVALVGVLGTIGALTRTNELTVMRACGVSLYRTALPLVLFGLAWSGLLFGIQETVLASANRTAADLRNEIRTGNSSSAVTIDTNHWMPGSGGRVFYYLGFEPRGVPRLSGLSVFETAAHPFRLSTHTYAEKAEYRDGAWHATNGWVQQFGSGMTREAFTDRIIDLPTPDVFGVTRADVDEMNLQELRTHIRRMAAGGFNVAGQEVRLHGKVAFPLAAAVMTVLGIPFGLTTGRRGAMYGIGLAIVLAFAYWLLAFFFVAAGSAGLLPPLLAAWATDILFLAVAVYLILTART